MKMSDVFNLPLTSDYDTVSDRNMTDLATFDTCKEDEAAVLAINNYDKLVEALEHTNQELSNTICLWNDTCFEEERISSDTVNENIKLLKQAKESG
ncbi:MAG: hypothetical protein GY804_00835, partial [Alphaproteobacteria bacterium]|nr:hypothetical protein [Alphaproteobacteria bacterium]